MTIPQLRQDLERALQALEHGELVDAEALAIPGDHLREMVRASAGGVLVPEGEAWYSEIPVLGVAQ